MTHVVTQACCADASCVVACPVNCIHPAPGEPGFAEAEMLYVDPAGCVDCGACVTACPVGAIQPHTSLTPAQEPFAELNASYFDVFAHEDRTPLALVPRQRRIRAAGPFRVAVIGAGPAGLYTADELLRHPEVVVDVFDRLPTPHGLVRAGVAPDHPSTRGVQDLFAAIEGQPGFRYVLGVEYGADVDLGWLRDRYHAVILATGASADRRLEIPGEDLPGSLSATQVVGWYNAHPDLAALDVHLDHERVVLVGNGNVALDVARILAQPAELLEGTDIADHALAALRDSRVREVVVLGRRGPAEAAYTLPELVGLLGLARTGAFDVEVDLGGAPLPEDQRGDVLRDLAALPTDPARRRIVLRFLTQPVRLLGEGRVTGVEVTRTRLVETEGRVVAEPTDEREVIEAGLVLRSVGYRALPVPELPFDESSHTVPHTGGRVQPGVYVSGWLKRGPQGFIGTNKSCAQETVSSLLDDLDAGVVPTPGRSAAELERDLRRLDHVDLSGWRAIDREERRRGAAQGRPRVRFTDADTPRGVARTATRSRRQYPAGKPGLTPVLQSRT